MSDPFKLPSELTIYSAIETRDALLSWVTEQHAKASASLKISAGEVEAVDGAGLQLLASLRQMDQSWQLVDPSPVFVEACTTMGLADWIDGANPQTATAGGAP